MATIKYSIQFFSEWHAGSGLTSGSDLSALVIKDKNDLPYIPGRTLKGLLREAAEELADLKKDEWHSDFIKQVFGLPPKKTNDDAIDPEENKRSENGNCFFSNANLPEGITQVVSNEKLAKFFFRSVASTAIGNSGVAQKGSLRTMETTIPCTLYAEITEFPNVFEKEIKLCFQWVKRMGQNRHRGLGRCHFQLINE